MIVSTVTAARDSGIFAQIVVTTDDDEIAAAGTGAGAEVLRRPPELGGDDVRLPLALEHALRIFTDFDAFCVMLPNCPLRDSRDIVASRDLFQSAPHGPASVLSVFSYNWCNPGWALREREGYIHPIDPDQSRFGSREGMWCPSGAVFWAHRDRFLDDPTFYPAALLGYRMPWHRALDIDTTRHLPRRIRRRLERTGQRAHRRFVGIDLRRRARVTAGERHKHEEEHENAHGST